MNKGSIVGRYGEKEACKYLRSRGYRLYERNVRIGRDEIDIIAFDPHDKVLTFVEVKSRSVHSRDYHPSLNVTHHKKQKMIRAARSWVAKRKYEGSFRMDLIYVASGLVVDHIEEVFPTTGDIC